MQVPMTRVSSMSPTQVKPEAGSAAGAGVAGGVLAELVRRASEIGSSAAAVALGIALRLLNSLEKARQAGAKRKRLKVVETLALGGKRQLLLVVCDDQEYLVGMGGESVDSIVPRQSAAAMAGIGQTGSAPEAGPQLLAVPPRKVPLARPGSLVRGKDAPGPWLLGRAVNRITETELACAHTAAVPAHMPDQTPGQIPDQAPGQANRPWQ